MIITMGAFDFKIGRFQSVEKLEDALSHCKAGYVYLGQKKGTESQWNLISVTDLETGEYFGVGLLSSSEREPHALIADGLLFLGADNFALSFDLYEHQLHTLMPLPADFLDFVHLPDRGQILILHKKGVVVKSEDCTEIWRNTVGPLESYSIDGELLILERSGGREVALRLKNGKPYTKN